MTTLDPRNPAEPGPGVAPQGPDDPIAPTGPLAPTDPSQEVPDARAALPPVLFQGRYELGPMLGRGGTCAVYRAWDTRLQRHVAIKRLQPPLNSDPHARARFSREGRAIARLSHPSLVTLIDRGSTEDDEYLVFEYIEGRSLKDLIKRDGPLDPAAAAEIAGQVAEGLAHAHLAGLVHRDVKPQNILLDAEGRAKLTDFGIATADDWTRVTGAGAIVGSSRYMSPEQVQGRPVDLRSDVYSLGVVFYEMLAGAPPFSGANLAEIGRLHVRAATPAAATSCVTICPKDWSGSCCAASRSCPRTASNRPTICWARWSDWTCTRSSANGPACSRACAARVRAAGRCPPRSGAWVPPPDTAAPRSPAGPRLGADGRPAADGGDLEGGSLRHTDRRTDAMRRRRHAQSRRRRPTLRVLAAVVAVVALGAVLFSILDRPPTTPLLTGQTLDQAQAAATGGGFTLKVTNKVSLTGTAGTVVQQDPAPGVAVPDGVVAVTVLAAPIPVSIAKLEDLDPEGDAAEQPDLLPLLSDGKDDTVWSTERYRSATFGGLKTGVGLGFELSGPATIVEVVSPDTGWVATLQVKDAEGSWQDLVALDGEPKQVIALTQPLTTGRIWITGLVDIGDGRFATRLGELRFYQ